MLSGLALSLRVSCPKWQPHNKCWRLLPCRHASNAARKGRNGTRWDNKVAGIVESLDARERLLEELFPTNSRDPARQRQSRELPRLPLDVAYHAPDIGDDQPLRRAPDLPTAEARAWGWKDKSEAESYYRELESQGDRIRVLVLSNASKSLCEEDFRRVIPQGKHIEGWGLERGDILKVIPGRQTATLEREDYYYILFKSSVSAFTYQVNVRRLHMLAQSQTPSSLSSPIPPPPGYTVEGQDVDALIQSYSLLGLNLVINLRLLSEPLKPLIQQIVDHLGYPHIVGRPNKSPFEVLFHLQGPQMTVAHIRGALDKAAEERQLPWSGDDRSRPLSITKWEHTSNSEISPRSLRRIKFEAEESEDEVKDTPSSNPESVGMGLSGIGADSEGNMDRISVKERERSWRRTRRTPAARYIIGFQTEAEAETFVRYWHARPMKPTEPSVLEDDLPPIVHAELIW